MSDKFSNKMMDKLSGELSEKEASAFEQELKENEQQWKEFQFFSTVWEDMESIDLKSEPSPSCSDQFYTKLNQIQEKEEQSLFNKFNRFLTEFRSNRLWQIQTSLGLFLIAIGFILGGKWNKKTINYTHNTTIQQLPTDEHEVEQASFVEDFVPTSVKIQQINSIIETAASEDEAIRQLKSWVEGEKNTNVKLAALYQLSTNYAQNKSLRHFLVSQLECEQSPLVQVELLNLIMDNNKARESVHTMESMLNKRQLNPIVQEKIENDLPVLRASY